MKRAILSAILLGLGLALAALGCDVEPTRAVVANELPGGTGALVVRRVVYRSSLFLDPVPPGAESAEIRVTSGDEPAYLLLGPQEQDPPDAGAPAPLRVARTAANVTVAPGDRVRIVVAERALVGCGVGAPLGAAEYAFLAERMFAGEALVPFADCAR